jgi:HPt (histidine-containing phosphotransfer) domain-containing protein
MTPEPPGQSTGIPETLPGFNLKDALYRVGNNWALLQNILFIFHRTHQSTFDQFIKAVESLDWDLATRITHTVKGGAATIGATALSTIAGELEALLKEKNHQDARQLFPKFQSTFNEALKNIENYKTGLDEPTANHHAIETPTQELTNQIIDNIIFNLTNDLSAAEEQIKRLSIIDQHNSVNKCFSVELIHAFEQFDIRKVKDLLNQRKNISLK